jgi:hypothetical protein
MSHRYRSHFGTGVVRLHTPAVSQMGDQAMGRIWKKGRGIDRESRRRLVLPRRAIMTVARS